jgi:GxxExxY protein
MGGRHISTTRKEKGSVVLRLKDCKGSHVERSLEVIHRVIQAAVKVHEVLGPGFVESIYARALVTELKADGIAVQREKLIKVRYGEQVVGKHLLDLVVDEMVIVELKANRGLAPLHQAQLRSYLQAAQYRVGLLLNFGRMKLEWEWLDRRPEV